MIAGRWLITGATGQLGGHVVHQLVASGATEVLALTGRQDVALPGVRTCRVDLADADALAGACARFRPTHVLHLGAMTAVGDCHARPADAERVNVTGTRVLADTTAGGRLVFASTDMVFDGERAPYSEADPPAPLSHYGRTKVAAERVLAGRPETLVVRLPLMYGLPAVGRETTFVQQVAALRRREPLRLFADEFRTPVWLGDAARAVIGLARSDLTGVIHIAGPERLSRLQLIVRVAELLGIESPAVVPVSRLAVAAAEPRPADLSLDGRRLAALRPELLPGALRIEAVEEV